MTPFRAEQYVDGGRLSELLAPPYDVITPEQRAGYAARNEHNIVALILPEGADPYGHAASVLADWRATGVLTRSAEPSVFVVRQRYVAPDGTGYTRTGLIAAVAAESYDTGRVKPHERTHAGPKEDRLALMRSTEAMFEALLMIARDPTDALGAALREATARPADLEATLDDVPVEVWRSEGEMAARLADAAAADGALYIADGHHRYETAGTYRRENAGAATTLALIVPRDDPGLVVLPTHRVLGGPAVTIEEVRRVAAGRFEERELGSLEASLAYLSERRDRAGSCVVALPGPAFVGLTLRPEADLSGFPFASAPGVRELAVAKIDSLIVHPLMSDPKRDRSYTPDPRVAVERGVVGGAAVLLNPTEAQQVLDVADAGGFMPQKSTYFAPKVPSGLAILSW